MLKTTLYLTLFSLVSAPLFAAPAYPLEELLVRAKYVCIAEVTAFDGENVSLKVQSLLRGELLGGDLTFEVDTFLGKPEKGNQYFVFSQGHDRWGKPKDEIKLSQGMHGQGSYCGWLMLPIYKERDVEFVRNAYSAKNRKPEEGFRPVTLAQARELLTHAKFKGQADPEPYPIPASGWKPGNRSWSLTTENEAVWQIADYNADGKVDYVRYQVPPRTFTHLIWVDRDYDGFFDDYSNPSGQTEDIHVAVPKFALINHRQKPADREQAIEAAEQRTILWKSLEKALPAEYRKMDVYAENFSLTEVLFRSDRTTLRFSLETGKVEMVKHAKLLGQINRITCEQRESGPYYALWLNGRRELTISAEE